MSGVDELLAFLRAALDRDEQVAREAAEAARAAEWLSGAEGSVFGMDEDSDLHIRGAVFSLDDIGVHIARWDPARVLAEVQAKRRILDTYETWKREERESWADYHKWLEGKAPGTPYPRTVDDKAGRGLEIAIKLIAQPYAGQPGWREEWAL